MDGVDGLAGESPAAQANEIHASIAYWLLACNDVGRDILTGARAALEHDITSYTTELVEQAGGGDNGIVIDFHLTSELRRVADDTAITDDAVVGHVHVLHQKIAIAYDGLAFGGCSP